MFEKLQAKWKVNGWQLLLIIVTFALGGSLCGYAGRKILNLLSIDQRWLWVLLYILLITLLWPVSVLFISIPLGQFSFFRRYVNRITRKLFGVNLTADNLSAAEVSTVNPANIAANIAIFASGGGSNAKKIIDHFAGTRVQIALIVCNKPGAGVIEIATRYGIPFQIIERERFFRGDAYISELKAKHIDLIVLAGFLWKVPAVLVKAFRGKIVNIHPALLPKYGGKGMYGQFVHEAVIASGDTESGISIHYVDDIYDHGDVIFQASCPVVPADNAYSLAQKIHVLEHRHYPKVIENLIARMKI